MMFYVLLLVLVQLSMILPTTTASSPITRNKKTRSNFILFQPDEMRAESLGCYGHPVSQTPNFDQFAKTASLFEQAHVSYTVCSQSRVSFMTGWPTHVRGHRSLWSLLHDYEPNLLKYFKQSNYTVMWWGKNDLLAPDSFNKSVTAASQSKGGNNGPNPFEPKDPEYFSFLSSPTSGSVQDTQDYRNVAKAIKFLNSKPTEPFFLFLPLLKPHPPYSCPEPFYSSIDPDELPPLRPSGLPNKPDYHALIRQYRNITTLDDTFWKQVHSVYLGSISFSDFLFGLLLAAVEENEFANTTTISVFSDHGDYAGDYGLVEKWPSGLEDVLTRVPLIVKTPGGTPGHTVKELVQIFDIVPTMLELAGIHATHVHFGKSFVKQLFGAQGDDSDRTIFAEGGYATTEPRDFEGRGGGGSQGGSPLPPPSGIYYPKSLQQIEHPLSVCRAVMARTMEYKLILRSDPADPDHDSELYDLQKDPLELHNVYNNPQYLEIQSHLKEKLLIWYMQTSDVTPWNQDPRDGGMPWPPPHHHEQDPLYVLEREDTM